jgi:transcription elongation factor GreA
MSDLSENVYQTTLPGLEKLKDELKEREEVIRIKIANTLNEMRSQGDLRENDAYSLAIEEQQINEEKILDLKEKIKSAKIITEKNKSIVGIGDIVTLKGSKTLKYEITSEDEANPLEGKISHLSPIGEAIMGKKLGTEVTISTPKGDLKYIIQAID